ncbi:MAG: hypothetical protein L0177_09035 [Chloroflexi bacterium]|nr:hypothetical protein [Chloroflexota bacterium]
MARSTKKTRKLKEACNIFIEKVRDVESVREVYLVAEDEGPTVWTVISAAPFKKAARAPVYEAMSATLRLLDEPLLDFYTLNLQELPPGASKEKVVPTESKLLWANV